jgi:hypothetical protein
MNRMRSGARVVGQTKDGDPIVRTPRSGIRVAVLSDGRLALAESWAREMLEGDNAA